MKKILIITVLLVAVSLLAGCGLNLPPSPSSQTDNPATNTVPDVTAGWQTFTDTEQRITFKYPEELPTTYLRGNEWPPKIAVASGSLSCSTTSPSSSSPAFEQVITKTIKGNAYCVKYLAGGAAGSIYTDYTYSTVKAGKIIAASFTIQAPQCVNYDDPQQTACQAEENTFDLDGLVDQIIGTVQALSAGNAKPVVCTMEAKLCPDGSAVGRTGPNCEFAPCPGQ